MAYTSRILATVDKIISDLEADGEEFNNTVELVGYNFTFSLNGVDPDLECSSIQDYFGSRYLDRLEEEEFHYHKLKYSLLHKVKEVRFFHKQDIENRKLIIFSEDCISSIQYIKRGIDTRLIVHMRSSDVKDLLPLDLLALAEILRAVNTEYCDLTHLRESIQVTIGSAHYYLEGGRE